MSTINIVKGSTYRDTLRWASSECRFVAAQVVPGAPVRLLAVAHGIKDGWPVRVEDHRSFDPKKAYFARVVDADTIELPCVNGTAFKATAATIRFNAPVEMMGYTARMQIKDKTGGVVLMELTSDAQAGEPRIILDDDAKTIEREIPASITEAVTFKRGTFDLEMVQGDYVIKIDGGSVTVSDEVTT